MAILQWGPPNEGVECKGVRYEKNCDFRPESRSIFKMTQVRAIVTMECEYHPIHKLSNGAIFNDLKQPLTQF